MLLFWWPEGWREARFKWGGVSLRRIMSRWRLPTSPLRGNAREVLDGKKKFELYVKFIKFFAVEYRMLCRREGSAGFCIFLYHESLR